MTDRRHGCQTRICTAAVRRPGMKADMKHADLTEKIIGAAYAAHNT